VISLFVRLRAKPNRADEVATALAELPAMVADEPGTLVFSVHRADDSPDTFFFYEVYADDAALRIHQTGSMVKEFGARIGDALAGPPEITYTSRLGAKGLPR
jgi:quinol monooxygenase YgiN